MSTHFRPSLRAAAAIASGLTSLLYLLVGFEMVKADGIAEVEPGPAGPLVIAGLAYAALTLGLALRTSRLIAGVGVTLTLLVLVGYVVVAPSRHPSYEPWGLAIKAVELVLLIILGTMLVRHEDRSDVPGLAAPRREVTR